METVVATLEQFGTRQTQAGEVFTLKAGGVEYSTFRREIWEQAAPYALQTARINYSTTSKNGRVYRNLEGVEPVGAFEPLGQPTPTPMPGPMPTPIPSVAIAPDYARPKHPDDRRDIARAVALDKAVLTLAYVEGDRSPAAIIGMANYYFDWLVG